MKIEELKNHQKCIFSSYKRKNFLEEFEIFESLCDNAKMILFEFIARPRNNFLYTLGLDDFKGLSPIEQIFNSVLSIYLYDSNSSGFYFNICPQYKINIKNKNYVADFFCSTFIYKNKEYCLDRNIVIECDGYDSHHTKEQRNRDVHRENELKLNGYSVIRFTGTQIFKEPFECFEKAIDFIIEQNKECIKKVTEGEGL